MTIKNSIYFTISVSVNNGFPPSCFSSRAVRTSLPFSLPLAVHFVCLCCFLYAFVGAFCSFLKVT